LVDRFVERFVAAGVGDRCDHVVEGVLELVGDRRTSLCVPRCRHSADRLGGKAA